MFNLPRLPIPVLPRAPHLPDLLARLPRRLQMFPHNFWGHPIMALLDVAGCPHLANVAHDVTLPTLPQPPRVVVPPCLPDSEIGRIARHMGEVTNGSWIACPPCTDSGDVTLECRGGYFSSLAISEQEDAEGRITYTLDLLYQQRVYHTPERPRPFNFADERTNIRAYGVPAESICEALTQMVEVDGLEGRGEP